MVYFVWCKYCYPSFFVSLFPFSWNVFFLPPLFFSLCLSLLFFKILFTYFQRQGGRKRGKHWCAKRNIDQLPPRTPLSGELACNPGMCPDRESKWWPFGLQAGDQSTESYWPGLCVSFDLKSHVVSICVFFFLFFFLFFLIHSATHYLLIGALSSFIFN